MTRMRLVVTPTSMTIKVVSHPLISAPKLSLVTTGDLTKTHSSVY